MRNVWMRYLLVGTVATAGDVLMPAGLAHDALYCAVAASGAVALVSGVRMHRPATPSAWYLIAVGMASWVTGGAIYSWLAHVGGAVPFPSAADAFYLATFPLVAAGLLLFARSRGSVGRSTALLDTVIVTVGVGLVSWVFLVTPTWAAAQEPLLARLVDVAYPLGTVLIFGALVRLAKAPGPGRVASRLLVILLGSMLAFQSLLEATSAGSVINSHPSLLDSRWLLAYVLGGAAAMHPSMLAFTRAEPVRTEKVLAGQLIGLAGALLIGPAILAGELIAGVPLEAGPVVVASTALTLLVLLRMVRMVRQVQAQAARLGELADTDFVTGLANSRRFAENLRGLLADPNRQATCFLIDVERFAEINDTLGHQTGDAILHAVGHRLVDLTPPGAVVARMGECTFGVLSATTGSLGTVDSDAVELRTALELPLDLPELSVSVEVSVGVLLLPDDGAEPALALQRSAVALTAAKTRPARTARYTIAMETGGTLAPLLIGELSAALEHGDIVLHYQPVVDVASGRVLGVEALARWQHARHGLLGPDSFIAAAEQAGLIGAFTSYVLDSALRQCARWRQDGLELTVAVNLSVRNLLDPGLVADVRAALDLHGLPPDALELEITESTAMVDPRRSMQVLGTLADMGIALSIDDYGTGHSSLAYLQRLPVRRLKIDRSFVTDMVTDEASAAIVRSTIELARHLHLDVIAEGVEDDATLLGLARMRCHAAQGFGLGRPVAAPLVAELIARIEDRLPQVLRSAGSAVAR